MSSQEYTLIDRLKRHVANGDIACATYYAHFHVDPPPVLSDPAVTDLTAALRPRGSCRQFPLGLEQREEYLRSLAEVYELSCRNRSLLRTLDMVVKDSGPTLIHDLDWGKRPTKKWKTLPEPVRGLFTDFSAESSQILADLRVLW